MVTRYLKSPGVRSGGIRYALVIGAETLSRITDWSNRVTCVLDIDDTSAATLETEVSGEQQTSDERKELKQLRMEKEKSKSVLC